MAIQIGKYKRPGIFIEELDKSVFSTPTTDGMNNLVIGVSKKGPINTPIRLTTSSELEAVFGQLDRNLERNGSFFHRTVSKMLESTPVYAMNLLLTDDNLDKIEYKSLSTSAGSSNGIKETAPYRRFFDTTGFWTRDSESFLNITKGKPGYDTRVLGFTNMSDRYITVFAVKSSVSGFDRTLLEWYGSAEKMPPYVNTTDYASDYMVDVVVVGGDWSNYAELSVDARWSQYFTAEGLKKEQLRNFANDRNITLLNYYEGLSLIPYFRDLNGRNIFIETTINRDTDTTGLFCYFNSDLIESDEYSGLIDLLGHTIAGTTSNTAINFLSYTENLLENIEYTNTPLDLPGNVYALLGGDIIDFDAQEEHAYGPTFSNGIVTNGNRTAYYAEGSVGNVYRDYPNVSTTDISTTYYSDGGYGIIGGKYTPVFGLTTSLVINASSYPVTGSASYTATYVLNTEGVIVMKDTLNPSTRPTVETSDIVLGYVYFNITDGQIIPDSFIMNDVSVDDSGFRDLKIGADYTITSVSAPAGTTYSNVFEFEFIGTNTNGHTDVKNYEQYRKLKMYNGLIDIFGANIEKVSMVLSTSTYEKHSLAGAKLLSTRDNDSSNSKFVLGTNIPAGTDLSNLLDGFATFYINDNEFIMGTNGLSSENVKADVDATGIVGKYSDFYTDFYNGDINTGDYFIGLGADEDEKFYLKLFFDGNNVITVYYVDQNGSVLELNDTLSNNTISVVSAKSNLKETVDVHTVVSANKILINGERYSNIKVGDFLEADTEGLRKLTRILSKRQYKNDITLTEVSCDSAIMISDNQATKYSSVDQYADTYKAITLAGFKIRQASMPDGTEAKQNQILNLVSKGTPLFKSLVNKETFDFRYLVDSFGLGLTERSKQQLVDICGDRLEAFGFINMPSIKSFKNSSSPSFVDSENVLQVEYIAKGGDPESNPAFLYSFGDGAGTTCTGYFTPYVIVNDNGRPLNFPPASYVATTYVRKHISNISSVTPWTIAAGVTNGKVTNIAGLEIDYTHEDIEFLNQAQMNPIVLKRNRGYIIETENTAQTLYKSALSYIHSREVLIELERELSRMLLDYQWKFNTPDVRAEIKLRADVICETFVSKNGLYNYFNKMDDENNTAEVIDNQMGILDTYIEIIKGMGIIVNNITILSTGTISSGGFINS